ncbi:NAD-dependent epimerase/dehydratase family protein [Cellulomonas sp. JH27-2]|uniref:NAD-dependent epimerase/dehydratase family protein n=1 Tax=Cellulomonas sp. JH27-2 TaxID=2774139 RepID=UPI00177AC5E0|nr:NAD-dependent epimerase/dehydratase family protein [Cellulomonas sp. JH27-2]MBD8057598.1 NAD-dependent epimerase/dehydratase family protein [Cellulomonas sp. JH27-2]
MRLLVLGGTRFVGRAVVADALGRGWEVTTLNRGGRAASDGVRTLAADRTDAAAVRAAIGDDTWDLVVDTWSGAPRVATQTAAALVGHVDRFAYVSSVSVYAWGAHVDEGSPLVEGGPDAEDGPYDAVKRGAELGVLRSFPGALIARPGLILGPHEDIGRLPWWLSRIARGGDVVAPGRPGRPLQYIDVRDLASWLLDALAAGRSGPYDVVGPSGATTTEGLLTACIAATGSDARLVWVGQDQLLEAGAEPWTQLPAWVPEGGEFAGFLESGTTKVQAAGLVCRPVEQTVADTWAWLREQGPVPPRDDRPVHGLPEELERTLLAAAR